jgi:surface antigen
MLFRTRILSILLVIALAGTTSCASIERQTGISTDVQTGAAVGAAAGGVIAAVAGANAGWIIAASVLGAVAGGLITDYMTEEDKVMAGDATTDALENQPTGSATTWQNPDSGNSGGTEVTDTYQNTEGEPCRTFTQTVKADGETESGTGTACRSEDGTWKIAG